MYVLIGKENSNIKCLRRTNANKTNETQYIQQ